ncbi:MAG: CDP-glycerol glycerophosphotransferase family protein [Bacillus sp. (in: firmicutes)]
MNILPKYSWYLDLLEDFQDVKWNGYSLIQFINIQPYFNVITRVLKISTDTIDSCTRNKLKKENEFQTLFEQKIKLPRVNINEKRSGKILLFDQLNLRFPHQTYMEYFNKNTTMIVRTNPTLASISDIPIKVFEKEEDASLKQEVEKIKEQVTKIMAKHADHPIYSNIIIQKRLIQEFKNILLYFRSIVHFFETTSIACVVVGGSGDITSKMLIIIAANKNIPSISLQHGLISANRGVIPNMATKEMVYSEFEKQFFHKWGVKDDQLEILGHPKYDLIFSQEHMKKNALFRLLGISPKTKTVLIATQPGGIFSLDKVIKIINYLTKYKIVVIIKPHPTECRNGTFNHYLKLAKKNRYVRVFWKGATLYDLIKNVDAVCVEFSTVGFESMLLGKPVCFTNSLELDGAAYEFGDYLNIPDPNKLVIYLKKLVENKKYYMKVKQAQQKIIKEAYPQKIAGKKLSDFIYQITGIQSYDNDCALPENTVVIDSNKRKYLLQEGLKKRILNEKVVEKLGIETKEAIVVDDSMLEKIPTGERFV